MFFLFSDEPENQASKVRARSNSADSWVAALRDNKEARKIGREDGAIYGNKTKGGWLTPFFWGIFLLLCLIFGVVSRRYLDQQEMDFLKRPSCYPLIPEPVEQLHFAPSVSVTPAPTDMQLLNRPNRPNQLDLDGYDRSARHLKPAAGLLRPVSPGSGFFFCLFRLLIHYFWAFFFIFSLVLD